MQQFLHSSSLALSDPFPEAAQVVLGEHPAHTTWPRVGALPTATKRSPCPQAALVLATFAWVLMHFINQALKKECYILDYSWSGSVRSLMIFRADAREEEEEDPHILERDRNDRMEDKMSPYQAASLAYSSCVYLFEETLFPHSSLGKSWCAFFILVIINHSHEPRVLFVPFEHTPAFKGRHIST